MKQACILEFSFGGRREILQLNKQPANSPDRPIGVTMNAYGPMLEEIAAAINSAQVSM
jgi:hypothetical protein